MTESDTRRPAADDAKRSTTRELIELAALFIATGVADLFVSTLSHNRVGPVVLFVLGGLLVVSAAGRRWWTHRRCARVKSAEGEAPAGVAWRVRATVRDVPGSLAGVTAALAAHRYDIVSMQVLAAEEGAIDEFLVRAPAGATADEIAEVTELGGGRDVRVVPADVHEFVDLPARVLTLATRLVAAEADLAQVLRGLLGDCVVEQAPAGIGRRSGEGFEGSAMRLVTGDGGLVVVTRRLLPFTPAEFARAKAVFELAQQLTRRTATEPPPASGA
ncbi:hypothetical protein OG738_36380 [Amycolatopsis sp. NBC_01488]|uniref:ACT domain-containing protein n=1 Tax=Amycolatopsis sp. NBC_01488 TaxID=2903563 RepID=UPI002E29A438|nr:ACT domain-containing protein [Amycolatopsis sp. NBC_01488]